MAPDQPHNIAIAEFEENGELARITGKAATEKDDAIQVILDLMAQEGIRGDRILRLYSERKPSPAWYDYFAKHWPNAEVTWSFGPGEDAKMDAAVSALLANPQQSPPPSIPPIPHWLMWCVTMAFLAMMAYSHRWAILWTLPVIAVGLIGLGVACFQAFMYCMRRKLARMTPEQRAKFLANLSEEKRRNLLITFGIRGDG